MDCNATAIRYPDHPESNDEVPLRQCHLFKQPHWQASGIENTAHTTTYIK